MSLDPLQHAKPENCNREGKVDTVLGDNARRDLETAFGPIVTDAGEDFERTPLYERNRARIAGLLHLERLNPDTFGRNLRDMLARQMTFAEADQSPEFRIVARQRLRQVWRPIRDQIALIA